MGSCSVDCKSQEAGKGGGGDWKNGGNGDDNGVTGNGCEESGEAAAEGVRVVKKMKMGRKGGGANEGGDKKKARDGQKGQSQARAGLEKKKLMSVFAGALGSGVMQEFKQFMRAKNQSQVRAHKKGGGGDSAGQGSDLVEPQQFSQRLQLEDGACSERGKSGDRGERDEVHGAEGQSFRRRSSWLRPDTAICCDMVAFSFPPDSRIPTQGAACGA